MKKLRSRMLVWFLIPVVLLSTGIAFVVYSNVSKSSIHMAETAAQGIVNLGSRVVSEWLLRVVDRIKVLAEKKVIAQITLEGAEDLFVSWSEGIARSTKAQEADISQKSYFKQIFEGKDLVISEPDISVFSSIPVFVVAAAFKDYQGQTMGLYGATIPLETLSNMIKGIQLGKGSFPIVVTSKGTVMVHSDAAQVMNLNIAESDEKLAYKGLTEIGKRMVAQESGYGKYSDNKGVVHYVFFTPIESSPGWSLGIVVPADEVLKDARRTNYIVIGLFVLLIVVIAVIVFIVATSISNPITMLAHSVNKLDKGDLTTKFETKGRDEVAQIAHALNDMAAGLRSTVGDILDLSLSIDSSADNLGDISEQLRVSGSNLNRCTIDINQAVQKASKSSKEFTGGISEIAASAQNIAKAAQDLANRSERMEHAARDGEKALDMIHESIEDSKAKATFTALAVSELSKNAQNIGEIVDSINSIAEQTNLLALNAAIEAARAGEAGRGFAVVADEIRKLAEQSKVATEKINQILNNIRQGAEKASSVTQEAVSAVEKVTQQSDTVRNSLINVLGQISQRDRGYDRSAGCKFTAAKRYCSANECSYRWSEFLNFEYLR
ncbi:methyl-accepting chemotaxis protein [Pseudothermotoga sp. U03pept]|uniref:methyl-accepting chemotaxis protein n=1 Tax=Pseudothermotoga sp. U03pept TaxID=3447012 RepID=UPI003EFFB1D5